MPPKNFRLYHIADSVGSSEDSLTFYLLARRGGNGKPMMRSTQFHFLQVEKKTERDRENLRILEDPDTNKVIVRALGQKAGFRRK